MEKEEREKMNVHNPPTETKMYYDLTGFYMGEIWKFSDEIKSNVRDVTIALLFLHSNLTAVAVSYMCRNFGWSLTASACDKILRDVADLASSLPKYHRPETRFEWRDNNFPQCFSIVDGVPCYCRGDAAHYNDKNHAKSVVFQVIVNLAGAPIAWSAGVEGSRTDAFAFDGWDAFPHSPHEFILADSMYSASAHCVTPWKANYKDETYTKAEKELFEMNFRKVRARVEHFFARLNRHAWISGARQNPQTIKKLFNFLLHLEARREQVRTQVIHYTCVPHKPYMNTDICTCGFRSLENVPLAERGTTVKRHLLAKKLVPLGRPRNKGSSKSAHHFGRLYRSCTQSEKSAKFALRRANRKEQQ